MNHLRHQNRKQKAYEGESGFMLGPLWAYGGTLGSPWATLGSLWAHFKVTLGPCGGHCGHMKVASGYFGFALGSL